MEITLKEYKFLDKKITLTILSNSIVGITGYNKEKFSSLLCLNKLEKATFIIGDNKITKENLKVFRKRIFLVKINIPKSFHHLSVKDFLLNQIKLNELSFEDTSKKLKDSLKIVNLPFSYLNRYITTLSTLEKKLILIANALIINPNILILEEPFLGIDLINEKKIMQLLLKLQDKYQKTIIIVSKDIALLYKYTEQIIIINESGSILSGKTNEILENIDLLNKNKILPPNIAQFTYLAKQTKNIKLEYHKDIRDIIKDIYKHV